MILLMPILKSWTKKMRKVNFNEYLQRKFFQ
jgi:hypothetical protein